MDRQGGGAWMGGGLLVWWVEGPWTNGLRGACLDWLGEGSEGAGGASESLGGSLEGSLEGSGEGEGLGMFLVWRGLFRSGEGGVGLWRNGP